MVNSKKLLSLFLAVVMVLSVFTVMASASNYTRFGTEGTADIDIKYTVEKVSTVPAVSGESDEWTADNLYAVTVWMKSAKPVDTLTVPFHYNKAHFAPITFVAEGMTFPYGAGLDQDTYYTDMEGSVGISPYSLGDYMNNTGMYKSDGTTTTVKNLAKCIGLGNANSAGVKITANLVSPDDPTYSTLWGIGLPNGVGVAFAKIDVATNSKTAYLNTLEGIATYTDWVNMFTIYFESITDEDVIGDEFGVLIDDNNKHAVDGSYDANGKGYYESAAAYKSTVPSVNVVSNAVIEETSIVNPLKGQMRYNPDDNTKYDVRALAVITGADFNATFTDIATAKTMIQEAGFVFAAGSNVAAPSMDAVKALVENGTAAAGYEKATVSYINTTIDPGNYVFSCLVPGINETDAQNNSLIAVGYIKYVKDGNTVYAYYPAAQTIDFNTLYNSTNKPAKA